MTVAHSDAVLAAIQANAKEEKMIIEGDNLWNVARRLKGIEG